MRWETDGVDDVDCSNVGPSSGRSHLQKANSGDEKDRDRINGPLPPDNIKSRAEVSYGATSPSYLL